MIEKFEVGKWYKCTKTTRQKGWNSDGRMDAVLDGKPHLCTHVNKHFLYEAGFDVTSTNTQDNIKWTWKLDEFEEVPDSNTSDRKFQIGDRVRLIKTEDSDGEKFSEWTDHYGQIGIVKKNTASAIAKWDIHVRWKDGVGSYLESSMIELATTQLKTEITKEETKMEKPKTELEKKALAKAKKEAIEKAIEAKQSRYDTSMRTFISLENNARMYTAQANDMRKLLNISDAEMKELF